MAKTPRLEHVKYVRSRGKLYAYFNTGKKKDGKPIRVALPSPASPTFFQVYGRLKAARDKLQAEAYTVASACNAYEASADYKRLAANTQTFYSATMRRIREALGDFPVNEVRRPHVQAVIDTLSDRPGAANAFLAVLGIVYRHARRADKTELHPTKDFDKLDTGAHKAWPESLVEAGLASGHDRTRLAVHLLLYTGQRIGDVMRMRWSDIREGRIFVTQQKTGKELWIPLHSRLVAELERTPKRGLFIITNEHGGPMSDQVVRREIKALGAVVPHGLRKNAVNALLEAGCTVAEVAAITGQSFRIVERYAAQINQRAMGDAAILKLETRKPSQ